MRAERMRRHAYAEPASPSVSEPALPCKHCLLACVSRIPHVEIVLLYECSSVLFRFLFNKCNIFCGLSDIFVDVLSIGELLWYFYIIIGIDD